MKNILQNNTTIQILSKNSYENCSFVQIGAIEILFVNLKFVTVHGRGGMEPVL
jgi:hypothetical protein